MDAVSYGWRTITIDHDKLITNVKYINKDAE
jgi:hypothetical protein